MTTYTGIDLNRDGQGTQTGLYHDDPGDGSGDVWHSIGRVVDGGHVTIGAKADAAELTPGDSASVISLLKGLLTKAVAIDGYPPNSTPVIARSGNVAAAAANSTLPAVVGKTNYLSGFQVVGAGATAASVILVTIVGILGGTLTYPLVIPAGVTTSIVPLSVNFYPAIPASAANTAIVVTVPSFGAGNTNAASVATGFVL